MKYAHINALRDNLVNIYIVDCLIVSLPGLWNWVLKTRVLVFLKNL